MGLRERKKAETRRRIAEAAHRLFGERGFQAVTVVEVARAAEVAEATLFNYFPTKEDLFYSGLEAFGARLVAAVRERPEASPRWPRSAPSCSPTPGSSTASPRATRKRSTGPAPPLG